MRRPIATNPVRSAPDITILLPSYIRRVLPKNSPERSTIDRNAPLGNSGIASAWSRQCSDAVLKFGARHGCQVLWRTAERWPVGGIRRTTVNPNGCSAVKLCLFGKKTLFSRTINWRLNALLQNCSAPNHPCVNLPVQTRILRLLKFFPTGFPKFCLTKRPAVVLPLGQQSSGTTVLAPSRGLAPVAVTVIKAAV